MSDETRFRKLPVEIEAWDTHQLMIYAASDWQAVPQCIRDEYEKGNVIFAADCIFITTLEGVHRADPADKIIKGVKGELYPCKPDIFAATYKSASNHANASAEEATSCVKQPCGHCVSLEVRSVESPAIMCELCEMRSQRNDALEMEKHYKEKLSEEAEKYRRLVEAAKWVNFNPYSSEYQRELRSALAPFKEE